MAISLRGTASNNAADGANVTVTLPGGTTTNDVVYAAYVNGSSSGDVNLSTVTAGYTELADLFADDSFDNNLGVYRKVQGGSPDTTVEFTGNANASAGMAGAVIVLAGVDTTTPEDATTTTATSANSGTPDPPSITTVTNNAWVIAIGGSSEPDVPTAPTNYGNLITDLNNDSQPGNVMMATRTIAAAGAENPGVFNNITGSGTDSWCAASVAVKPAAGGGISISADAGSYAITGQAAALKHGFKVAAGVGGYDLTGSAAALKHGWKVAAGVGSHAFTGQDAALILNSPNKIIVAQGGGYSFTGSAASLLQARKIVGGAGAYDSTGQAATLRHAFKVTGGTAAYSYAGVTASLIHTRRVTAGVGSYSINGQTATLKRSWKLAAASGGYLFTGSEASLFTAGAVSFVSSVRQGAHMSGAVSIGGGMSATITIGANMTPRLER